MKVFGNLIRSYQTNIKRRIYVMTPDCYKEAVVDRKSRGLVRYISFIPPSSQPLGAHFAMNAQCVPPSECGVSPFYMKTDFLIISLVILWRGFTFCADTNHKIPQSRLAANFFSTVLVPILPEREAVQSRQQICPSAADLLRVSLEL